jgi:pantoate--beta-alanine ligase
MTLAIRLVTTAAQLRAESARLLAQKRGASQGLVPTMGALHEGHAQLARTAVAENDVVVVSIFVNPLQFGEAADLERYPRTLEADMALLDADGALTVVAKLLHYGMPGAGLPGGGRSGAGLPAYRAYFGQKDAQQLALVRRMVEDLNFPVEIVPVPIVRSADGLALSSRNRFLSGEERQAALVLSRALRLIEARASAREPLDLDSAQALVESQPLVELDYFDVVDPRTLEPLAENCRQTPFRGEGLAIIAARVGPVRLIDNVPLDA